MRIVLTCIAASLNYLAVVTFFVWVITIGYADPEADGATIGRFVAIVATVAGVAIVVVQVRRFHSRTLARLGAVPLAPGDLPVVQNLLEELAIAVGTRPVQVALLHDEVPNALAVGRHPSDTTVVVTTGLVDSLARDELEGVLAAEMWAVRRLDTALQTIAIACCGNAVGAHNSLRGEPWNVRLWLPVVVTWPLMVFAELLRWSALRHADFGADALAVATTRHPQALRRALVTLRAHPGHVAALERRTAPLWFEPLPHDDIRAPEVQHLRLGPTLDERIGRLPVIEPESS